MSPAFHYNAIVAKAHGPGANSSKNVGTKRVTVALSVHNSLLLAIVHTCVHACMNTAKGTKLNVIVSIKTVRSGAT